MSNIDKLRDVINASIDGNEMGQVHAIQRAFAPVTRVKCGCGIVVTETDPAVLTAKGWTCVRGDDGFCPGCSQMFKKHGL